MAMKLGAAFCNRVLHRSCCLVKCRLFCAQATTDAFQYDEFCIAIDRKERKFLWKLEKGQKFHRSSGYICHDDIVGCFPGSKLKDVHIFRPSLEEYVLLMKRGPTPAYPKDVLAMMGMLDLAPGSHVIEGGSGSGAMALYLSRAVYPNGRVFSFDVKQAHLDIARRNYHSWLQSGNRGSWSDNVTFLPLDLHRAAGSWQRMEALKQVQAVALDVQHPVGAVRSLVPCLQPSGVMVVLLPNITQVAELMQAVAHYKVPLRTDRIVEVTHRYWDVNVIARPQQSIEHFSPIRDGKCSSIDEEITSRLKGYRSEDSDVAAAHGEKCQVQDADERHQLGQGELNCSPTHPEEKPASLQLSDSRQPQTEGGSDRVQVSPAGLSSGWDNDSKGGKVCSGEEKDGRRTLDTFPYGGGQFALLDRPTGRSLTQPFWSSSEGW